MATKIKIIISNEFLEITPDGILNIDTSRQLLVDIAKAEQQAVDYELLVDFRETTCQLSIIDLYQLAGELCKHGHTFRNKVALLVLPGIEFNHASFFETCSYNRGYGVNAFIDYDKAIRWLLSDGDIRTAKE